ncbi:BatA and WFA domain-containing protein [Verrucomicrobiaceae bacterium 227]
MSFLSQSILWGLFAAAIPVIIHLLNRRRFRTVKWAATTFLLKASRESRGKKKLKHILILTCRALAIVALIFAVARPLMSGLLGGAGSVNTVVLVLDRSASMELRAGDGEPSHRQSVLNKVADTIETMGSPRLVLIDSATGEVQDVPSPDVLTDLSTTFATDTQADIPTLLSKAVEYLGQTQPGKSEIWLASDLQRGDWRPSDSRWQAFRSGIEALPAKTTLRILTAGEEQSSNFALELLASRRIDDELFLDLRLIRTKGKGDTSVNITSSLMGNRTSERVTISGQELRFQKRLPLTPTDDEGYGWIGLNADNNPRDNAVYFAFGGKEPIKSWVVRNEPDTETVAFLQRAAAPTGFERYSCGVVNPNQTTQIDWDSASLIIWQAPIPTGTVAAQLTEFVESGGSAIFFPPESDSTEAIFGVSWGANQPAPENEFFINGSWIKDDGPWQNGESGGVLPVEQLRAVARRSIQGDATTLAEWDDKSPLMARQIQGLGRAIFIGTLPDDRWSNLEFTALHLVAIQRLLLEGSDRLHAGYRALAGSEKAMTVGDESRTRLDTFEDYDAALGHYRAGVYRLGERVVAVNRPVEESAPDRVNKETLDELLEGTSYTLFENKDSKEDLVSEAWRAFLIAVLLFLIAEALLCLQPKPTGTTLKSGAQSTPAS